MSRERIFRDGIEELADSPPMYRALFKVGTDIASRARVPSRHRVWVKRGVGPKDAFAQVILEGPGALAIEYGTRTRPPLAPLRRALRGGR